VAKEEGIKAPEAYPIQVSRQRVVVCIDTVTANQGYAEGCQLCVCVGGGGG
jgi:hypothetical protein